MRRSPALCMHSGILQHMGHCLASDALVFQGTTLCRYPWFDQQRTSLFLAFYSPVSNGAQWQRCTKAVAVYFWLSAVEALTLRLTSLLLRLTVLLLELITENPYATVHTQTRSSTSLIRLKDERRKTMQTLSYPITSTATLQRRCPTSVRY